MDKKIEEIVRLFECPVCYLHMAPPIMRCASGHVICCNCYHKVMNCPLCRGPKIYTTVPAMEEVYKFLPFPCRHAMYGCLLTTLGRKMRAHELNCIFRPMSCIHVMDNGCSWSGNMIGMNDHLTDNHKESTFIASEKGFITHYIGVPMHRASSWASIIAFDSLFRVHWAIDNHDFHLRMTVSLFKENAIEGEFSFELCIFDTRRKKDVIKLRMICEVKNRTSLKFDNVNHVMLCRQMMDRHSDHLGNLFYRVKIIQNDLDLPELEEVFTRRFRPPNMQQKANCSVLQGSIDTSSPTSS